MRGMFKPLIFLVAMMAFTLGFIADGFCKQLFWDDFENETLGKPPSKWQAGDGNTEGAVVEDPDGNGKVFAATDRIDQGKTGRHYIIGDDSWTDYIAEWDWMFIQDGYWGIVFRYQDPNNYYLVDRRAGGTDINFYSRKAGSWALMKGGQYPNQLNVWYRCRLEVIGSDFSFRIKERSDDTPFSKIDPILEASDSDFTSGGITTGGISYIDNIVVGETEADLTLAVSVSDKLATVWGTMKR